MNYLSVAFFIFILIFLVVYYLIPAGYRYIALFLGSYGFYGFRDPKILLVLFIVTLISYLGGFLLDKYRKSAIYWAFFLSLIAVLALFKYFLGLPVGLSFIIFQTCTYLSDIYRKGNSAEINFIRYGAFAAFFPTILSGPIQQSRKLLPQIKSPAAFTYENAQKGTLLFAWGAFEKIMVADKLEAFSLKIIGTHTEYSDAMLLVAAIAFSFYIYADFSAYSDMARGVAKILGVDVGRNFKNPYLSVSTSEFWRRWHVSLNDWFVENVYIPLGGNRKGTVRKHLNILIVFALSGIWHGSGNHFIAWGIINGILVIAGSMIAPVKSGIYRKIGVDENNNVIKALRRLIVFIMITFTWLFFSTGIKDALFISKRIITFNINSLTDPKLITICGTGVLTAITFISLLIFMIVQIIRQDEASRYAGYIRQPFVIQCLSVAAIICICIFGYYMTAGNVDTRFLYFNF